MKFLYPFVRQFPFDSTCDQIVRELEKRNWQVPDIAVEFHEYGDGGQKFCMVSQIKGHDFKLRFCREQCLLPGNRFNDTAAVAKIVIPKRELSVYVDESGPVFHLYVGNDYERDRNKFMNCLKVNSKLRGEPKMYLRYHGACYCSDGFPHIHPNERPPYLAHTNDLGREYDHGDDKPKLFSTAEVMRGFKQYLEYFVLNVIISHPITTERAEIVNPTHKDFFYL